MDKKNFLPLKKVSLGLSLLFAGTAVSLPSIAQQTSVMPLTYAADKAIANNPEVQRMACF